MVLKGAERVVGEFLLKRAGEGDFLKIQLLPDDWNQLQHVSEQLLRALDPAVLQQEDPEYHLRQRVFTSLREKPNLEELCIVLNDEARLLIRTLNTLREEVQRYQSTANDLQDRLRAVNNQLDQERTTNREQIRDNEQLHQAELSSARQQHQVETTRLSQAQESYVAQLSHDHNNTLASRDRQHTDAITEMQNQQWLMQESHHSEVEKLKGQFDVEAEEMHQEVKNAEAKMHAHIEKLDQEYIAEIDKLKAVMEQQKLRYRQDTEDMIAAHNAQATDIKQRLKAEISGLSQALVSRDDAYKAPLLGLNDLKRLTDEDIKSQFTELVQLVDDIARIKWREDQTIWDELALQKLRPTQSQRLLKKNILQDSIWLILHHYVFCSPFRVFDEPGKVLEKQWVQQAGKNDSSANGTYSWPQPGIETERWRYITIKECRMALVQALPSDYDPRAKLKKGFKANLDKLRSDLRAMLAEIVQLDKSEIQLVDKLAIRTSDIWLGYQMQRCRIVMKLQASKIESPIDKAENLHNGSLELDLIPRLGRYGNSKGDDLDTFVTISGCDGEVVRLS